VVRVKILISLSVVMMIGQISPSSCSVEFSHNSGFFWIVQRTAELTSKVSQYRNLFLTDGRAGGERRERIPAAEMVNGKLASKSPSMTALMSSIVELRPETQASRCRSIHQIIWRQG